tara:strand:+ start:474 stop:1577 length:1104 start_codon:yes stop_codon:yes gene_type:complete
MPAEFHYFPFDDGPGEDSMENRWEAMMQYMRTTGILIPWDQSSLEPSTGDLAITANGGLSVQSAVGEGWVHGFMFQQQTDYYSITISPNSSGEDRIDLVTARLDTDANTIVIHVEEGTPSMSPVAPTPVESDPIWDLPLAEVYVEDSAVTILPDNITDLRVISTQGAGGSSSVTLASAGGDETLVAGSNAPPNLVTKGLIAGSNISLSSDADTVTITVANAPADSPLCIVRRSTNLSCANNSIVTMVWDIEDIDSTGTMWESVTNPQNVTIPEDGYYLISVHIFWGGDAAGNGMARTFIRKNGGSVSMFAARTTGNYNVSNDHTVTIPCLAGDIITVHPQQTSGTTLNVLFVNAFSPALEVRKVREL